MSAYRDACVLIDGSDASRQAAELALEVAARADGRLTAITVDEAARSDLRRDRLVATLPEAFRPAEPPAPPAGAPRPAAEVLAWLESAGRERKVPVAVMRLEGSAHEAILEELARGGYDVALLGATGLGALEGRTLGSTAERLSRRARTDLIVVRDAPRQAEEGGGILACIDGSPQSYAGLQAAIDLASWLEQPVEAVGVYDPYLHYTLFNGVVNVLSAEASKVFKFKDQEKLHEEIIDTGLAKIYQAHLEVARSVARERGVDLAITLLDGKAFQKVLRHAHRGHPWLAVMGRIGVHSRDDMDIGATSENLLRQLPCSVLLTSRKFVPPIDVRAQESVQWTEEALAKMQRVPDFVRGVARTAVVRWAIERGHSVITPSVINGCMGDMLPPSAAQAMGYVAEEVAKAKDDFGAGKTFICRTCGYAARDYRPVTCPVCKEEGPTFEAIDRESIESLGQLSPGAVEEPTFDGKKLTWTTEAKDVLRRVPNGYERRRAKARIEKTAKVRGLGTITEEFALDMVEQEVAEGSYLSAKGERLEVEIRDEEKPDDEVARPREASALEWTDAAWKRICRVPEGFMRDMTREKVEEFAGQAGARQVNLALCEEGIAEGRRIMADMLSRYRGGSPSADTPEG